MTKERGFVDLTFGGQAGSEGKGKLVGHMVRNRRYGMAIADFSPNAGHTWREGDRKVVVTQVPIAHINTDVLLALGPGSVLDKDQLLREIDEFGLENRIVIDSRACVVQEDHKKREREMLTRISSTCKGSGMALADKVCRHPGTILAGDDPQISHLTGDVTHTMYQMLRHGKNVLIEGAQGFDLDLDHGLQYPYCTSRHTTPMAIAARCGVSPKDLREVWAVIRTYPIRVGNVVKDGEQIGYSGDYDGAEEITWEEVARRGGLDYIPQEITTVTGKVRRVFEFHEKRVANMLMMTGATHLAVNFADYLDSSIFGRCGRVHDVLGLCTKHDGFASFGQLLGVMSDKLGVEVGFVGTGPNDSHAVWSYDSDLEW